MRKNSWGCNYQKKSKLFIGPHMSAVYAGEVLQNFGSSVAAHYAIEVCSGWRSWRTFVSVESMAKAATSLLGDSTCHLQSMLPKTCGGAFLPQHTSEMESKMKMVGTLNILHFFMHHVENREKHRSRNFFLKMYEPPSFGSVPTLLDIIACR